MAVAMNTIFVYDASATPSWPGAKVALANVQCSFKRIAIDFGFFDFLGGEYLTTNDETYRLMTDALGRVTFGYQPADYVFSVFEKGGYKTVTCTIEIVHRAFLPNDVEPTPNEIGMYRV